jgi:hypothetical protein
MRAVPGFVFWGFGSSAAALRNIFEVSAIRARAREGACAVRARGRGVDASPLALLFLSSCPPPSLLPFPWGSGAYPSSPCRPTSPEGVWSGSGTEPLRTPAPEGTGDVGRQGEEGPLGRSSPKGREARKGGGLSLTARPWARLPRLPLRGAPRRRAFLLLLAPTWAGERPACASRVASGATQALPGR